MKWQEILLEIETNAPTDSVVMSSTKKKKARSSKNTETDNIGSAKPKVFKSKKQTFNIFRG